MHFNVLAFAVGMLSATEWVTAHPAPAALSRRGVNSVTKPAHPVTFRRRGIALAQLQQLSCELAGTDKGTGAAGEEEEAANEVNINGAFDVAVPVQGGELKQDILFTRSTVGNFEFEFQGAAADEVTVSENAAPAPPPAGFEALEANSFVVSLAQSKGVGLTLSKIDYIFDTASTLMDVLILARKILTLRIGAGLAGKDITKAQVGRLCAETGAFVITEALGELEFELEENEVSLNLNKNVTAQGEWGEFTPHPFTCSNG